MLNSKVNAVEYNLTSAHLTLGNGTVINALNVISTVSLGVLKANTILFNPKLSADKNRATNKMAMASYTKIYVKFNKPVLTEIDPPVLLPTTCTNASNIQNINKKPFFPGCNAVMFTILSESIKSDVVTIALDAVNQVVKEKVSRSMVLEHVNKNFDEDPFFRGAYCNLLDGFDEDDWRELIGLQ